MLIPIFNGMIEKKLKQPVIYTLIISEPQVTYNLRPNNMAGIISKITARPA
jgi:hypothetical protein